MHDFQDVFISYGRADSKAFAVQLHEHLMEQGIKVWFDQADIPLAVDYQNQIDDGIEKTDNFVFIISPHSVNSPYCLKEIELAIHHHKRIVPLMHVEQISCETWQQRHPNADIAEWDAYQAKGLHSSFLNIHPAISKINWLYFREGIENFDDSFTKLMTLFEIHQDYVKKHTHFLVRALNWQRQQQQSRYLLTGEERYLAADWLQRRFQDEQPPCVPTDLHCEYITESVKNANNLMTQVFLSYSEQDSAILENVRRSLMREGFTVWSSKTDIQTGVDFQVAIDRGLEEADNIVYLLSPASLQSEYCQHEIEYALSLNKRIIPVLVRTTDPVTIPPTLRNLQYIDITQATESNRPRHIDTVINKAFKRSAEPQPNTDHNSAEAVDYRSYASQLIKILHQDELYYHQHKLLLAKALKWQRQNQNPSLLLRGHNLHQAEAWLKLATSHPQHLSTALHQEFIAVSLQQPTGRSLDVFIAYSSADADFARRLNDALQIQGKTTWFDQESIASGSDFQQEIFRGIEASNNFLFIISPNSLASSSCVEEIEYAYQQNKRVVTILHRPVPTDQLPPNLVGVQWIDFNQNTGDFFTNFSELIRTLDTDRDHKRLHTRLLIQSLEWSNDGRDPSRLLRGKELIEAEQWLKVGAAKQPQPTELQQRYIATSRYAPLRRPQHITAVLSSLGAGLLVVALRLTGWLQPLEIAAYDQVLRGKPTEPRDQRMLLVAVDDEDIKLQNKAYPIGVRGGTLPDPSLALLFDKLQQAQARVIGLDMYRDFQTDQPSLRQHFQQNSNLIVLCKLRSDNGAGVQFPYELPAAQVDKRLGFSDLLLESRKQVVRRQLLVNDPMPPDCPTERSFSLTIARQYLESQGKFYQDPFVPETSFPELKLGDTRFPRLNPYSGGYQQSGLGGYQILLNFRRYQGNPDDSFIEQVTLRDVLQGRVPAEKIRDRIVLVGFTARAGVNDYSITPFGELPGVVIQAHMVSQLISAVLDGRSLIWWLPVWGDALWIWGWALVGGILVWALQFPRTLIIMVVVASGVTCLVCYHVLALQGGWLPLVPSLIALPLASGITLAVANGLKK